MEQLPSTKITVSFIYVLIFCVETGMVHCDPYVTWNGTNITGPILIFHDEILLSTGPETVGDPDRVGALVCRSDDDAQAGWHFPVGVLVDDFAVSRSSYFQQIRTGDTVTPSLSRLLRTSSDTLISVSASGYWSCRVNGDRGTQIPVGLHYRGTSFANVRRSGFLTLQNAAFLNDPPSFVIQQYTRGGPPANSWMRDAEPIGNSNSSFAISSRFINDDIYANTLTVTGRLPGVYQYSVTNRAITNIQTSSINIEGGVPTNLTAREILPGIIEVAWIAPSTLPPQAGYRVTVDSASTTNAISSPHILSALSLGGHTIQVQAISQHFPSDVVGPVEIMVTGTVAPNISLLSVTATSISLSWTQPAFSLQVQYIVSVTPLPGNSRMLCAADNVTIESAPMDSTTADYATANITGLQEFSLYTATVIVRYAGYSLTLGSIQFTTLSAAPSSPPQQVNVSTTSRSVSVSWNTIECIEHNGPITGYVAELSEVGGGTIAGNVAGQSFNANGLIPHTSYSFRVAGVNINGTGPFSNAITIHTNENIPGAVLNLMSETRYTSALLTWSPPSEPNGVILTYKVTYRVNDSDLIVVNSTSASTRFTISSLTPLTRVSDISVNAYTTRGQGEATSAPNLILSQPPSISNVLVEVLTGTSVLVSWNRGTILNIQGYRVYYRPTQTGHIEEVMTVPSFSNSATIISLRNGVEYQFQVVAMIVEGEDVIMGGRSLLNDESRVTVSQTVSKSSSEPVSSKYGLIGLILGAISLLVSCVVGMLGLVITGYFVCKRRVKSDAIELQQNDAYSIVVAPR